MDSERENLERLFSERLLNRRNFLAVGAAVGAAAGTYGLRARSSHAAPTAGRCPCPPHHPLRHVPFAPGELLVSVWHEQDYTQAEINDATFALSGIARSVPGAPQLSFVSKCTFAGPKCTSGLPAANYTVLRYKINACASEDIPPGTTIKVATTIHPLLERLHAPGKFASITPNWPTAAAQNNTAHGGPGGDPIPAPPSVKRAAPFSFYQAAASGQPTSFTVPPDGNGVMVVVLDTFPHAEPEARCGSAPDSTAKQKGLSAAVSQASMKYPNNQLLRLVAADLRMGIKPPPATPEEWLLHDTVSDTALNLDLWRKFCGGGEKPWPNIADHGLFVAGVIKSIAPRCRLSVARVLNDTGAGYLFDALDGLSRVAVAARIGKSVEKVVINLSLNVVAPVGPVTTKDFLDMTGVTSGPLASLQSVYPSPEALAQPLYDVIDLLSRSNLVVVAAAGNRTCPSQQAETTLPAVFENVVGVAALAKRSLSAALYSSRGDDNSNVPPTPNYGAIATFGGEAAPGRMMYGLYSAAAFPDGQSNVNGWAGWTGTSFAAAVVSGLMAALPINGAYCDPVQYPMLQPINTNIDAITSGVNAALRARMIVADQTSM